MHRIISLTLIAMSIASTPINIPQNPTGGCKLIGSNDSEFRTHIGESTASSLSTKALTGIQHDSVVISNGTMKTVVAYVVRWTFRSSSGTLRMHDAAYAEPLILKTHQHGGGLGIAPGSARVLHPNFNVSTQDFARLIDNAKPNDATYMGNQFGEITGAELDGVIFDDGTFFGPNKSDYFLKFKTGLNARHDAGVSVLLGFKNGKTDAEIVANLERQVRERDQYKEATAHDYYNLQRSVEAEQLLSVFNRFGHDALINNATMLRDEPHQNIIQSISPR